MRVVALISTLVAIAAVLLFIASETSLTPLNLPLEQIKWRYFMAVLIALSGSGWAWNRHHINELRSEISAAKQEIRDVCKLVGASRASL
jgi:hypothetical protein